MKGEKVGFFGGTFDPIHFGHVNICLSLLERGDVDRIIVCPSGKPAFKTGNEVAATAEQRLEMVKIAFSGVSNIIICDYEIQKQTISYTVETLQYLNQELQEANLYLIMGSDSARSFPSWKDPKAIMKLAKPLVISREGDKILSFPAPYNTYFKDSLVFLPQMDISSSVIKNRLSNKMFCNHLLPAKVLDYICINQLYFF